MASIALERKTPALPAGVDLGSGIMGLVRAIRMFGGDQLATMLKLRDQYGPTYSVTVGGELASCDGIGASCGNLNGLKAWLSD